MLVIFGGGELVDLEICGLGMSCEYLRWNVGEGRLGGFYSWDWEMLIRGGSGSMVRSEA